MTDNPASEIAEIQKRVNELRVALEINTLRRIENTLSHQCIFCDVISASQTTFPHRQECICHDETA